MTNVFKGTLSFESPINSETSYGCTPLADSTASTIEVTIGADGHAYFDWEVPELELYETGTLTFEGNELVDYDGVMCLPQQLVIYLEAQGYNMEWAKD